MRWRLYTDPPLENSNLEWNLSRLLGVSIRFGDLNSMAHRPPRGGEAIRFMIRDEQSRRALHKLLGLEVDPVLPLNFVSLLEALEEAEEAQGGKDDPTR